MKHIELGNLSQVVSAAASAVLVLLAIYGVFFSNASQAVVAYLNTELAARNSKISSMELREKELTAAIKNREVELVNLDQATKRVEELRGRLEDEIAQLQGERQSLSNEVSKLQQNLGRSEFDVVREKIVGILTSQINFTDSLNLISDAYKPGGSRARSVHMWSAYNRLLAQAVAKLPPTDQHLAARVTERFEKLCGKLSHVRVDIPALRFPSSEEVPTDQKQKSWNRDEWPAHRTINQRIERVQNQLTAGERELETCLRQVTF